VKEETLIGHAFVARKNKRGALSYGMFTRAKRSKKDCG
jgi:hypothetical protein